MNFIISELFEYLYEFKDRIALDAALYIRDQTQNNKSRQNKKHQHKKNQHKCRQEHEKTKALEKDDKQWNRWLKIFRVARSFRTRYVFMIETKHFLVTHKVGGAASIQIIRTISRDIIEFEQWYQKGVPHRLDGPSIITRRGNIKKEKWYYHGKLHRLDGPALIERKTIQINPILNSSNILKEEWYYHGKPYTPLSTNHD